MKIFAIIIMLLLPALAQAAGCTRLPEDRLIKSADAEMAKNHVTTSGKATVIYGRADESCILPQVSVRYITASDNKIPQPRVLVNSLTGRVISFTADANK